MMIKIYSPSNDYGSCAIFFCYIYIISRIKTFEKIAEIIICFYISTFHIRSKAKNIFCCSFFQCIVVLVDGERVNLTLKFPLYVTNFCLPQMTLYDLKYQKRQKRTQFTQLWYSTAHMFAVVKANAVEWLLRESRGGHLPLIHKNK